MSDKGIKNYIVKHLVGDTQNNALEFVTYLKENDMQFYRDTKGYWEDKLYWHIMYNNKYVCFILINGYEEGHWVIWFEDADSDCFADFPVDDNMKEIVWANVDIFKGDCGGGQCEGLRKIIFGKEFESLYRTLICFNNPNAEAVESMKKLTEIFKCRHPGLDPGSHAER